MCDERFPSHPRAETRLTVYRPAAVIRMRLGASCIRTVSGHKHEILNFLVAVLRTPEFVLALNNFRAQIPNRK